MGTKPRSKQGSRKKAEPKPDPVRSRQQGKRSNPDYIRAGYLLPGDDVDRLRVLAALTKRDQSDLMAEALAALLKKNRKVLPGD